MNRKVPMEAFSFYCSLGPDRSYQAVADKYSVSKRAISKLAGKESWVTRVVDIEKKAQEATDKKLAESLEQMTERHVKVCKLIQGKALETLKSMPLSTAMDAVRALEMAIKTERVIRGEPSDRAAVSIEDAIKKEYSRWMVTADTEEVLDATPLEEEGTHEQAE